MLAKKENPLILKEKDPIGTLAFVLDESLQVRLLKSFRPRPATLLKKRLWPRCFPVNFVNFLRTPFFTEHL